MAQSSWATTLLLAVGHVIGVAQASQQLQLQRQARRARAGVYATQTTEKVFRDGPLFPCTCDCCVSQLVTRVANGLEDKHHTSPGMVCVPRAGEFLGLESGGDDEAGCSATCQVSDTDRAKFNAVSNAVDYSRFCIKFCDPLSAAKDKAGGLLCAPLMYRHVFEGEVEPAVAWAAAGAPSEGAPAGGAAVTRAALPPPRSANEVGEQGSSRLSVGEQPGAGKDIDIVTTSVVPSAGQVSDALLRLARSQMMEAKRHAHVAGMGAKAARTAYEAAVASTSAMGKAAGKATFGQIRRTAGQQAWQVFQSRQRYVENAQEVALKIAEDSASVYEKAKARDVMLAGTWNLRARQFATAAEERRQAWKDATHQASKYTQAGDWSDTREFTRRARNAMDLSEMYERHAEAARREAETIINGTRWYDLAAQAAEANQLVHALPPGVPPPALPPVR